MLSQPIFWRHNSSLRHICNEIIFPLNKYHHKFVMEYVLLQFFVATGIFLVVFARLFVVFLKLNFILLQFRLISFDSIHLLITHYVSFRILKIFPQNQTMGDDNVLCLVDSATTHTIFKNRKFFHTLTEKKNKGSVTTIAYDNILILGSSRASLILPIGT